MCLSQTGITRSAQMVTRSQACDKLFLAFNWQGDITIQLCGDFGSHDTIGVTKCHMLCLCQLVGTIGGKQFKSTGGGKTLYVWLEVGDDQCTDREVFLH